MNENVRESNLQRLLILGFRPEVCLGENVFLKFVGRVDNLFGKEVRYD